MDSCYHIRLKSHFSVKSKGNSPFKDLWNIVDSFCSWIPEVFWYSRNFSGNIAFTSIPNTELSANRHSRYISRAYRLFEINQSLQNLNITFWAYVLVFITLSKVLNSHQSFYKYEILTVLLGQCYPKLTHFWLPESGQMSEYRSLLMTVIDIVQFNLSQNWKINKISLRGFQHREKTWNNEII